MPVQQRASRPLVLLQLQEALTFVACAVLSQNKRSEYCAPLTSFDWNQKDLNIIGTTSIDTTCTVWDLEVRAVPTVCFDCPRPSLADSHLLPFDRQAQKARTQLIAHDKSVFDIAWGRHKDEFATVGADGSIRMFDLR